MKVISLPVWTRFCWINRPTIKRVQTGVFSACNVPGAAAAECSPSLCSQPPRTNSSSLCWPSNSSSRRKRVIVGLSRPRYGTSSRSSSSGPSLWTCPQERLSIMRCWARSLVPHHPVGNLAHLSGRPPEPERRNPCRGPSSQELGRGLPQATRLRSPPKRHPRRTRCPACSHVRKRTTWRPWPRQAGRAQAAR